MSEVVVEAESVGKCYRLGEDFQAYSTVRDAVSNLVSPKAKRSVKTEIGALNDVSFQLERGEILGIIGANGAGKTTLLKLVSRITAPTRGSVRTRGRAGAILEIGTGFHD